MNLEYPMYSPFELGKLYKGFVFSKDEDIFKEQLINFKNIKSFKWMTEKMTEKGTYQPIPALIMNDGKTIIRTNSLLEIDNGDLIEIKHPAFKKYKYFIVVEPPIIDSVLCPKWRQTFQHITIKPIIFKEPNVQREKLDD